MGAKFVSDVVNISNAEVNAEKFHKALTIIMLQSL
jgi:hypothetical protein